MIRNDSKAFRDAVESVTRQIVTADHRDGLSFIKTPLLYPSGSTVVVRVNDAYPKFFVSDYGTGHDEAEMMGGALIFTRHAPTIATDAGIGFDRHAFFVAQASREQLAGVVTTVANCSQEAVAVTGYKLAERTLSEDADLLYRRLVSVFTPARVARDVEIAGYSNTRWKVDAVVKTDAGRTAFEAVSHHHSSIFAAVTKFHDIGKSEHPPRRVAVVRKKEELRTYLAVLTQAAAVIEREASSETIASLAA